MKTVERILMKAAIIQFIFLLLSQCILHQYAVFPQINQITKYEGVTINTLTKIVETMNIK